MEARTPRASSSTSTSSTPTSTASRTLGELDNNLDLTDPADAANDPDGDGVSNLDEFLGGTDPNSFDGPSAATLVSPIEDAEVDMVAVDLVFEAATDPQGDTLTYTVELYSDASLTTLVATFDDVAEGVGTTTVTTDALDENAEYAWRVQAEDSFVGGSWTDPEGFFVNAINEPPDTPTLLFPVNDEPVDTLRPAFEWTDFADVDRDGGTTTLEVEDTGDGSLVASIVVGGERDVATLDVDLTEDAHYRWRVQPTDEHGLASDWSEYATFGVDTTNAAPSPVMFVSPEDGETVTEVLFEATESEDAEGDTITYAFEVDLGHRLRLRVGDDHDRPAQRNRHRALGPRSQRRCPRRGRVVRSGAGRRRPRGRLRVGHHHVCHPGDGAQLARRRHRVRLSQLRRTRRGGPPLDAGSARRDGAPKTPVLVATSR